jgi:hypothetical protein
VALTGCVIAAQPGTFIEQGSMPKPGGTATWYAWIMAPGSADDEPERKVKVTLEYDLIQQTARLTNTGEQLPLSPEKVYTVFVDREFRIERFVALDPTETPSGLPSQLANFSQVMSRRHGIREAISLGKR